MSLDLINDRWILVRRRSGETSDIAPWELTSGVADDPIEAVSFPRADLTGATTELLIGLLQTSSAPQSTREWQQWFEQPPPPERLRDLFAPFAEAFQLAGGEKRFLQDVDIRESDVRTADELLIDVAGSQGHFVHEGEPYGLCEPCAAAALYTLQAYAPAGGRGHLTSMRGGGPLVTMVVPDTAVNPGAGTLWHLCWANVLSTATWRAFTGEDLRPALDAGVFPWLGPTRTAEKLTTPEDVSWLQVYWGMPRRIKLDLESLEDGDCGCCGRSRPLVSRFFTRPRGVRYDGAWRHPLTPFQEDAAGTLIAVHPNPGGLGYQNWPALVLGDETRKISPAAVVRASWMERERVDNRALVWAFGFDMDRMKPRCWYEARMPVFHLPADTADDVRLDVANLITASREVASNLRGAVKRAWFRHPDDAKRKARLADVTRAFWDETESPFFSVLEQVVDRRRKDDDVSPLLWSWFDILHETSLRLFSTWCHADTAAEPADVALAEIDLRRFNHKKTVREALLLDVRREVRKEGGENGSERQ